MYTKSSGFTLIEVNNAGAGTSSQITNVAASGGGGLFGLSWMPEGCIALVILAVLLWFLKHHCEHRVRHM